MDRRSTRRTKRFTRMAPRVMRACAAFAVLVAVALPIGAAPGPVRDDAAAREAGRLYAAAEAASLQGDHKTALRALDESFRIKPHPGTLYQMAQESRLLYLTERDPENARKALEHYQRFVAQEPQSPYVPMANARILELVAILAREPPPALSSAPPPPPLLTQLMVLSETPGARILMDALPPAAASPLIRVVAPGDHAVFVEAPGHAPEKRTLRAVESRLVVANVELHPLPGRIRVVSGDEDASVYVDGRLLGRTPFEQPGFSAGEHSVAVTRGGRKTWSGTVRVESDRTALIMADLRPSSQRHYAVGTGVATALLAVAGGVTGLLALQYDASMNGMPTSTNEERRAYDDRLQTRDRMATASTVLFGVATAGLLTTAGLWWFDQPGAPAIGKEPSR